MTVPRAEKAYEKYAWVLLLATGVLGMTLALVLTFAPSTICNVCNPEVLGFVSALSTFWVGMNAFGLAITLKSYRSGEKWAWYTLWYFPAIFLIHSLFVPLPHNILSVIMPVLGLLLPYRKFFPKHSVTP